MIRQTLPLRHRAGLSLVALAALGLVSAGCSSSSTQTKSGLRPPPPAFTTADTDQSGTVDAAEWEGQGDLVFEAIDTNKDGVISEAEMGAAFDALDTDGDGRLSESEASGAALDVNGDGFISREEWLAGNPHGILDRDGDGDVSRAEMAQTRAGTFRTLDTNTDNSLSRVESQHGRGFTVLRF